MRDEGSINAAQPRGSFDWETVLLSTVSGSWFPEKVC